MRCKIGMEAANDCEVDLSLDLDLIEKNVVEYQTDLS